MPFEELDGRFILAETRYDCKPNGQLIAVCPVMSSLLQGLEVALERPIIEDHVVLRCKKGHSSAYVLLS